ncbi:unnamed protein product [Prorocentrum cordatum]|uniref:Uncharacterized protein n=1 Tax=Prorocentrum cordatum TaxID=2364126 RepID=A0ABN9QAH5_9DINO|nr:unnamed protein product [Polarella glacialis]
MVSGSRSCTRRRRSSRTFILWMARNVLQEKDKGLGDGGPSDPRERISPRLHMLRYEYKTAKRKAADSAKWASEASAQLSEEARQRIAANRQRALEIKQKKAAEAAAAAPAPAADGAARAAAPPEGGLDMETLWAIEDPPERRQEAQARKRTREEAAFCRDDEEDDVFGFGGGFDADEPVNIREVPKAAQPPRAVPDEEEDVFGFGGGMGEDRHPAPPVAPASGAAAGPRRGRQGLGTRRRAAARGAEEHRGSSGARGPASSSSSGSRPRRPPRLRRRRSRSRRRGMPGISRKRKVPAG